MSKERNELRIGAIRQPATFEAVRPGDIISSDFINRLLLRVARLEARVEELEARPVAEPVERVVEIITRVEPEEGQAVGQVVTLTGHFATPAAANTVFLDKVPITEFVRAGGGLLSFIVPASFNVPQGKTQSVKLTAENNIGKSVRDYVLKPAAQAAADNPEISSVEFVNISNRLAVGAGGMANATGMLVRGRGFAERPAANQVRIELRVGGESMRYPKQGSFVVQEKDSGATQLWVELPHQSREFLLDVRTANVIAVVVRARDKEAVNVIKEEQPPPPDRGKPVRDPRPRLTQVFERDRLIIEDDSELFRKPNQPDPPRPDRTRPDRIGRR
ncbi:MAG TPA: hypothetical protein VEY09_06060 [Pyrinomonadaceae bacterium]|nr:hypothetical protein [Pyrinomonadaceae bacterium]